jgi:hypothetical protein
LLEVADEYLCRFVSELSTLGYPVELRHRVSLDTATSFQVARSGTDVRRRTC